MTRGADKVIEALDRFGVEYVFGHPGGAAMPIFDALLNSKQIRFVLTRHEQGATHMADGYARATGKPGVVLVTSGPGATNTITGLLTALMDSAPVIALTGQTVTPMLGKDAFQEADVFGISMPVVKHSYLVRDPHDIPRVMTEAFHIATTGRQGRPCSSICPRTSPKATPSPDAPPTFPRRCTCRVTPGRPSPRPSCSKPPPLSCAAASAPCSTWAERLHRLGRSRGGQGLCRKDADAGDQHPARQGGVPRAARALGGYARHARHGLRQQSRRWLRPNYVGRRTLGRPDYGQALGILPRREKDPHRHRPSRIRQSGHARRFYRGRCAPSARRANQLRRADWTRQLGWPKSTSGRRSTRSNTASAAASRCRLSSTACTS